MKPLKLHDNINTSEGLLIMKGNVKILDDKGNVELDKDNAITDYFRRLLMAKLFNDITIKWSDIDGITDKYDGDDESFKTNVENGYISEIRFGSGSSANVGAKASKKDTSLVAPIPTFVSDGTDERLYINTSIFEGLNVEFDFTDLKIVFSSDLINNDNTTYILGELGIFYETETTGTSKMLTHLFFDPIFFEPDTSKKIIYTIYFY